MSKEVAPRPFGCRLGESKRTLRFIWKSAWRNTPVLALTVARYHHGQAGRHAAGAPSKPEDVAKPDCFPPSHRTALITRTE